MNYTINLIIIHKHSIKFKPLRVDCQRAAAIASTAAAAAAAAAGPRHHSMSMNQSNDPRNVSKCERMTKGLNPGRFLPILHHG